jgi:hypothetical protein
MTEFAFDMILSTTVRVQADNLEEAVDYLRGQLDCWSPGEAGIRLPTGGVSGVQQATITEVSLGGHRTPDGAPVAALALFEAEGEALGGGDSVDLDDMRAPVLCDKFSTDDGVECHEVYDEQRGDGYMGECPAHADAASKEG